MKKRILITAAMASIMLLTSCGSKSNSDVLPEIPVTDESAFEYEFNSKLGGMVITDYLEASPNVRIPDNLEGKPVRKVFLIECQRELTQLVMPDSVIAYYLSDKTAESLQYLGVPSDAVDYNVAIQYNPSWFADMSESEFYDNTIRTAHNSFSNFKSLISIGVSANNPYCSLDGILCYKKENGLILLVCPQGKSGSITVPNNVTEIGDNAFYNCIQLTSVTIPDSVAKICEGAFDGCVNIKVAYKGKAYDYEHISDLYQIINNC